MTDTRETAERRRMLINRLFPGGVPKLWCPSLTHYHPDGGLDDRRITRHLHGIAPYARGLLVPGSTGDAWEMDAGEQRDLLDLVLDVTAKLEMHVLIGALRTDADEERRTIVELLGWLQRRSGLKNHLEAITAAGVCGFTVCPPTGPDLPQADVRDRLASILELGVPTALYQLPQVTHNEMAPETVAELADRYANFYLLKDTSGEDHVAASGLELGGVFLVRGAEGDYDRWLKGHGGPYDGFLLSTANCFAPQLHGMIEHLRHGRADEARTAIAPVQEVVGRVFAWVADLPQGNPFTNANKAIDHFLAFGPEAPRHPPPRLHAGTTLPRGLVEAAGRALADCGLMPRRGYLEA